MTGRDARIPFINITDATRSLRQPDQDEDIGPFASKPHRLAHVLDPKNIKALIELGRTSLTKSFSWWWLLYHALPSGYRSKDILVFASSLLTILPLTKLPGSATEEFAQHVASALAGLFNPTLENTVGLIVAITALARYEPRIVQSSVVESIISNLLLIPGMSFLAGRLNCPENNFSANTSQLNSSSLKLSIIATLIPAAFQFAADTSTQEDSPTKAHGISTASHRTLLTLVVIYMIYMLFRPWSHRRLYQDDYFDVQQSINYCRIIGKRAKTKVERKCSEWAPSDRAKQAIPMKPGTLTEVLVSQNFIDSAIYEEAQLINAETGLKQDEQEPRLNAPVAVTLLVVITILVSFTAKRLVDSIDGPGSHGYISPKLAGIVLLPIVSNPAEHVTAVTVSFKDKLKLSLGIAVGQFALFVILFVVGPGWMADKLLSDPYAFIVLLPSVLIFLDDDIQDRESDWLEILLSKLRRGGMDYNPKVPTSDQRYAFAKLVSTLERILCRSNPSLTTPMY